MCTLRQLLTRIFGRFLRFRLGAVSLLRSGQTWPWRGYGSDQIWSEQSLESKRIRECVAIRPRWRLAATHYFRR